MARSAASRLGASPRRTSSASSRRRVAVTTSWLPPSSRWASWRSTSSRRTWPSSREPSSLPSSLPSSRPRSLHRVDLAFEPGEVLLRREPERRNLRQDLLPHRLDDTLGVLAAAVDELLHLLLGLLGLELARSHEVADDLLSLRPGGLCERHAGFEVLPNRIELCHGPTRYRPAASVGSLEVIPLRDNLPTQRRPVATIVLIAINVAVFLLVQSPLRGTDVVRIQAGTVRIDSELRFDLEYAAIPCEITQGRPLTIDEIGKTFVQGDTSACDHHPQSPPLFPDKNVYLAVITSMFLHGGWLHLGFNMLFLWVFGNNVEDRLGWALYLLFYVLAGIFATAGQIALNPSSTVPVIGASGAIAGVMGAYLVWFPRAKVFTLFFAILVWFREIEARVVLLVWLALQFLFNRGGDVAWMAHVAGFGFGMMVAWLLRPRDRPAALSDPWSPPPGPYR